MKYLQCTFGGLCIVCVHACEALRASECVCAKGRMRDARLSCCTALIIAFQC